MEIGVVPTSEGRKLEQYPVERMLGDTGFARIEYWWKKKTKIYRGAEMLCMHEGHRF